MLPFQTQKQNCQHQQSSHQHTSTKHGEIHVLSRNTEEKMGRYPQASCIHDGHIGVLQQGVNAPVSGFHWDVCRTWYAINKPEKKLYIYLYVVVDQNSFIPERPFFANKNFTFAKLSRTPCLSFAGPTLANNTSYKDSFTTCLITPENHGSLLDSLLNMQLASRNPFSGQIVAD